VRAERAAVLVDELPRLGLVLGLLGARRAAVQVPVDGTARGRRVFAVDVRGESLVDVAAASDIVSHVS
jgi:hypothetical protein